MICSADLLDRLETVYREIQYTRMQGMPVINQSLEVKALSFICWNRNCLGIMLTPWFMNLMLLPGVSDDWTDFTFGEKVTHGFPSGLYEFTMGYEAGIDRYQMCSLFSPMSGFVDQAAALATAQSVMDSLMNEQCRETAAGTRASEIARIWHGDKPAEAVLQAEVTADKVTLQERLENPISRRELLRADFLRES